MFEIPVLPVCAAFDLINQDSVLGREGMTVVCSFKDLKIESKGLGYTRCPFLCMFDTVHLSSNPLHLE